MTVRKLVPPTPEQLQVYAGIAEVLDTQVMPGLYGQELVDALARVTTTVAFEVVPLRTSTRGSGFEVLLVERPAGVAYAGQNHMPGKLRIISQTLSESVGYVIRKELDLGSDQVEEAVSFGFLINMGEERGEFLTPNFWIDLTGISLGEKCRGVWTDVMALPDNMVEDHAKFLLPLALESLCDWYGMTNPLPVPDQTEHCQWIYMPPCEHGILDLTRPF